MNFGEGLRAVFRLHSALFGIGRDSLSVDFAAGVAGAAGPTDRVFRAQWANGAQDVDLAVAQITVTDRRLHGDQLQEMILQHVFERSDAVVVAALPSSASDSSQMMST